VLGIACGVAAVIGMVVSARSALSSFSSAVQFLNGRATHSMERIAGPMDEGLLSRIMRDEAVSAFSPVIDRKIRLESGESIRLLGIDPFLDRSLRPELVGSEQRDATRAWDTLSPFLLEDNTAVIDAATASRLKLHAGSRMRTSRGALRILGTFTSASPEPLSLMDIGHAQKLFRLEGRIDRVDLILNDPEGFAGRWHEGFRIASMQEKEQVYKGMLQAFRLNLEALSLIALFVGVFLIYNTTMFAVVSRRKDAGILRSLGASRGEVAAAFLIEILIFGFLGGALGGCLGFLLSRFLTGLVGQTISDLYFFLRPAPLPWSWSIVAVGTLLGCSASLLGSIFPLLELVRLDPVTTLQGRTAAKKRSKGLHRTTVAGLGMLLLTVLLLLLSPLHVYVGFAAAFSFLFSFSLLTGSVIILTGRFFSRLLTFVAGVPGRIAAGNIRRNLSRTAVAVAAFMVALAMTVGLGSMIGSFRHSLIWWMNTQILADVYVGSTSEGFEVPEGLYEELKQIPGVGGADAYRNVHIQYRGKPAVIVSIVAEVLQKYTHFGWLKGGNENWEPVKAGAIIVSESFARNFKVSTGDTITLPGVHGPARYRVAAVFYDYTTEHGLIMMDRSTYIAAFGDHTLNSVGLFIDPANPRRPEILAEAERRAAAWGVPMFTLGELRGRILGVFDSTFAVTRSMRILAIVVAFFGITGALLTLFIERQREFGIYRALGFSTRQVAMMTLMEGLGMGIISFMISVVVGSVLAVILIKVINLQSFNWTIFYYPLMGPYLLAGATAVLASMGAALYPILRIFRTYPHMQLREE
jgi:putative ABC transport system permease protein